MKCQAGPRTHCSNAPSSANGDWPVPQGLEFIVLGSAVLAVAASLTDTADFAEGLSSRLLGVDNPPSPPEPAIREKEVRVRNPVTGRWIRFGGPTYSKLVSQGLLVEGAEVFEQPALTFSLPCRR